MLAYNIWKRLLLNAKQHTQGKYNYTSLETMTKMCHLSVSYTRALTGQLSNQEFKAYGRSSDPMKSKQISSTTMGRMTSHCMKFKAAYGQETCKAVGVCTQLILEIPWSQTKDSPGKADGGLKCSRTNCCQSWAGIQSSVFQPTSWAGTEQPSEAESPSTSFDLVPQWMHSCCNSGKVLNIFYICL